ncbi:MAG TPA: phosphomannomutase/phosphoglucomutase, partial [Candidatus Kapabacteria bacterium]|nr:phosphomannomutase/phosphoglucomutase [Candidatus Kapabacteria bacterium]
FREYDIRGRVNDEELNVESVAQIAGGYGTWIRRKYMADSAIIGYDSRKCSPDFRDAVAKGLNDVGINCVDIGMVTTPVFYFSQYLLGISFGIMITGSHNPDGWSGFKMANGFSTTLLTNDIKEIYELVENKNFETGAGQYFRYDNIKESYIDALKWRIKPHRRLRMVIDAGNSIAGQFGPPLFRAAGFEVIEQFCELDPGFPYHFPNPSELMTLEALRKKTLEVRADIGIAFDGDGDRLGVIDDKGNTIPSDRLLMLLSRQILETKPGAKIVFDVKCSNALIEDIKERGGVPVMWKTGHSYIKQKIKEEYAALGGEQSGHIFIVDNFYGFDDAIFSGLRLAEYLSYQTLPLSEILKQGKQYYSSPNIQVNCPDEIKYQVVDCIIKDFQAELGVENVITINGARVNFGNGWGLIRASSNIPALVVMMEAETIEDYLNIKNILRNEMLKYPSISTEWENDINPF